MFRKNILLKETFKVQQYLYKFTSSCHNEQVLLHLLSFRLRNCAIVLLWLNIVLTDHCVKCLVFTLIDCSFNTVIYLHMHI